MKKKLYLKLTLFFILCLSMTIMYSCKKTVSRDINPEFAKYIAAFTYGNISSTSSIHIELTQDIPSVELNKELDTELFEFSPSIKGKAYWTGSKNIRFDPEPGELKSGVEYKAIFRLGKVLKVDKDFSEFNFFFKIPNQNFSVEVMPYSPTRDNDLEWNTIKGILKLADNASIDKVAQMFSVSGASDAKVNIIPAEAKGIYNFSVDSLRRTNSESEYKLNIKGGPIEATKDTTVIIKIPAFTNDSFFVIDVQTVYDPQQCIRITFSDPLKPGQKIEGLVSPNGIKNFSYNINKNVLRLFLEASESTDNVNLKIFKELKNQENKPLDKNYTYQLTLRNNKPDVKILNSGNILPNSTNLHIPFQAVNLWAVDVKVIKIFENNILGYLQTNNFGGNEELRRFGRLVLKKRIRLDEDPSMRLSQWNTFNLDLAEMIKQDPGAVYRIQFSARKEYSLYPCDGIIPQIPDEANLEHFDKITEQEEAEWDRPNTYYYDGYEYGDDYDWDETEDPCKSSYYADKKATCVVMASNIGMIAKMGTNKKMNVAVSDILSTNPISGANIDIYNYQMQRIGSGKTDGNGFSEMEYKGGVPFVVVASKGKEKGYLKVSSNLSLSLSNFDVSGKEIQKGLKGFIYGERGVWRPGDSIYLTFVLDDKDKTLPQNHPVSIELFNPRGQLYAKKVETKGVNGFYPFKLATDANAPTGNWSAIVRVGGTTFRKNVMIETIKPNRLKVRLDVGDLIDASLGSFVTSISSQWLHGAPASNLKAKVEMSLSRVNNPFKGYEAYSFNSPANKFNRDTYFIFDGRLDATGNANFTAKLPPAGNAPGLLQANITSRVFETGGDASFYTQSVPYSPYSNYVGVKTGQGNEYGMLETDVDNPIDIITLSADGKLTNRVDIQVKVYKIDWAWWWSNNNEDLSSYVNNTSTKVLLDQRVSTTSGKARVNFQVKYPDYGRYLVMVKDTKSGHTTGKIFYVDWPSWRGRSDKQDPNGLTMLAFSTDKKNYNVGEKATVIIPKSSQGNVLVSIENGFKIIHKEWVKTSSTEDTKYTFKVTEEMTPNFYVFATLLQPHAQTINGLPIRMYGVLNVSVENKNTVLQPEIKMADELRPEQEFTVSVSEKNKKKMTYTLAVVDEGLLDLTSFKTPNAWNDFYSRQALGVRTWDLYDLVVGASAGKLGPLLSIGGDESLNPANNQFNRFKPIVKYIGPFTAKAGEIKTHKIKLDNYIGSIRVMVVAGNEDSAYGSTEKTVPVNNPLMILSTLPRVAGPDEDITLPVNVFVTKDYIKDVSVSITTGNFLQPNGATTQKVSFTEKGDKVVYFKLKAAKQTGLETIKIKATGGGEVSNEIINIEIRNPNPPVLFTSDALVSGGQSGELSIEMESPQPKDWVKFEISRMPAVDLSRNINYLLSYPHGCSEQVTSKGFPMLYAGTFTTFTPEQETAMKANVEEAIRIITSRQLSDGGVIYWPGNLIPNEWVTSYAGHFLIEAQNKGYNVPGSVIDKWKQFQKKAAQSWNKGDIYKSYYSYSMADLQQAYRLYTLALAGEPELGAMNRLKEVANLSVQARWRLAAAYAIAGKKEAAEQIIYNITDNITPYSFNNNTYGSIDRDRAMIMETYLLLGRTDKALALSGKLSEKLSSGYVSTQLASYGLIAMSKLAEKMGSGSVSYDWELNGVKQKTQGVGKLFQEISIKPQEKINIKFTNKGDGELFVRLIGYTQPLTYNLPPTKETGINLYIKYLDLDGKEMDVSSLKQGTEFYASVIVQNVSGEYLTDMVLSQIFASGWEIFNERLFGPTGSVSSVNYKDIRDDRVYTYFNVNKGYSSSFRVRLQAAYCGRFYLPAVSCEAMYKPEEQARTSGRWVEVVP